MNICIKVNGEKHTLPSFSIKPTPLVLAFRGEGKTFYTPLIQPTESFTTEEGAISYSYTPNKKTVCVLYKGKVYKVPNTSVRNFHIPVGSYNNQQAFKVFNRFIKVPGFKKVARATKVKYRRQEPYQIPVGTLVYLLKTTSGFSILFEDSEEDETIINCEFISKSTANSPIECPEGILFE